VARVDWRFVCCALILHIVYSGGILAQSTGTEALGSLQTSGEVYLNGSRAAGEQTVFPRDVVRTGEEGVAAFTLPGVATLNILPQTEVSFRTSPYLFTLKQGTLEIRSFQSAKNLDIQFGNFVMSLPFFESEAAGVITVVADGAALVECRAGSVGLIGITSAQGLFLRPGQLVDISADGKIQKVETVGQAAPESSGQTPGPTQSSGKKKSRVGYIILGGVAAGTSVGVALALSHKASSQPVSPSAP
jgi:hypothetical protein